MVAADCAGCGGQLVIAGTGCRLQAVLSQENLGIGAQWERDLRADTGHGLGGHRIGPPHGIGQRPALAEKDRQAADKRIARAGGVHRRHLHRGHVLGGSVFQQERAALAQA